MFALSRLGFGVLFLSTRLGPEACLKLMKDSKSHIVIQSASTLAFNLGYRIQKLDDSTEVHTMAGSDVYRSEHLDESPAPPPYSAQRSDELHLKDVAVVFHSSGSTGFPKALSIPHEKHIIPWPFGKMDHRALTGKCSYRVIVMNIELRTVDCSFALGSCLCKSHDSISYGEWSMHVSRQRRNSSDIRQPTGNARESSAGHIRGGYSAA